MKNLTADERRALAFIAALLFLSAAVRLAGVREPVGRPAGGGFDLAAHIAATERAVEAAERASRPLTAGERIDVNSAPAAELERLPGVGPALAERLVESRERDGSFRSAGDLERVSGVGERTAARLSEHLIWGGASGGAVAGSGAVSPRPWGGGGERGTGGGATAEVRASSPARVDINSADTAALAGLPGIGPVLAARIVAYRDSAGPFGAVEDLLAVRGIGPATLSRLADRLGSGGVR